MTKTQLDKLNKGTLVECLLELAKDSDNSLASLEKKLEEKLNSICNEIVSLNETVRAKNELIDSLKTRLDKQDEIIAKQQRSLESLDRERRENKVVVTGVPDANESLDGATDDESKLRKVLDALGAEVTPKAFIRLGKEPQAGRRRPLLVTLESKAQRDRVLSKTPTLKNRGGDFARIFVKKDSHPNVRAEWTRLFKAEQDEKKRPENVGCVIKLDFKQRQLLRDGIVIDSWNPAPF